MLLGFENPFLLQPLSWFFPADDSLCLHDYRFGDWVAGSKSKTIGAPAALGLPYIRGERGQ